MNRPLFLLAFLCAILVVAATGLHLENLGLRRDNRSLRAELASQEEEILENQRATASLRGDIRQLQEWAATAPAPSETGAGTNRQTHSDDPMGDPESATALEATATTHNTRQPEEKPSGSGGFRGHMSKMLEDPEMREAMRAQQKIALDMLYSPLFAKLDLTAEETDLLKDLLVDQRMAAMTAFRGEGNGQGIQSYKETEEQVEEAIRTLLGEERFPVYQDYQATLGERFIIKQLNDQLAARNKALSDVQQEELITLMVKERENSNVLSQTEQQEAWMDGVPDEDALESHFDNQQALHEKIHANAGDILEDTQREALKDFLDNQLKMQRLGLRMMRSMMDEDEDSQD